MILRALGVLAIVLALMLAAVLGAVAGSRGARGSATDRRSGWRVAPGPGAMLGIGGTACPRSTLAALPVLATASGTGGRGAVLSLADRLGLGIPLFLAAPGIGRVLGLFTYARRRALAIMRIGGAPLGSVGILELTGLSGAWLAGQGSVLGAWHAPW